MGTGLYAHRLRIAHDGEPVMTVMNDVSALFERAVADHRAGRLYDANTAYEQILRMHPDDTDALQLSGLIAHQCGDQVTALQKIGRAIELDPKQPSFFVNYGNVLHAAGRGEEGERAFRRAIELDPDFVPAHINLAMMYAAGGNPAEAARSFRRATELVPDSAELHCDLGVALNETGDLEEAESALRRAVALDPQLANAHYNLGIVLLRRGNLVESLEAFRRTLDLAPDYAQAHINYGFVLWRMSSALTEAQAACERGLALHEEIAEGHVILGNILKDLGDVETAIAHYRRALEIKPDDLIAHANLILSLHYLPSTKPAEVAALTVSFNQRQTASIRRLPPRIVREKRRLSIGYVSANLRTHPGGFFLGAVLGAHDRDAFKISCYVDAAEEDEHSRRIKGFVDRWESVHALTDEALAERIRADEIDILVDMNRFSGSCRLRAFARKPAPVQVTWMGGPITTTGLTAMDYALSDAVHTPPDYEAGFVEKIVRLDNVYAIYQAPPYAPAVAPLPALQNGHITFGCFNYLAKLRPEALQLWQQILEGVPASRLLLQSKAFAHEAARERILRHLDRGRVELIEGVPHPELLALYGRVDIALDPFPYSGGITTCEALWMGVPVITMPGSIVPVRHSVSHLSNAGLRNWIAASPDEYAATAIALASDTQLLAETRAGLRERLASSQLCNAARFTRQLEHAYRVMWTERAQS
jgi:protein O-GlcNAc transferase